MKTSKTVSLIVVLLLVVSAIAYIEMNKVSGGVSVVGNDFASSTVAMASSSRATLVAQKALQYPRAKELVDPTGFINTPNGLPITISQYIGKDVILVDFWTYSCINCQRTIPYLNTWYSKYQGDGFVIIGVHTPEFDFEKDINNVKAATQEYGIKYPVVLDSDMGTWNAYGNLYWPREYLIDIDGFIREDHIGEGGYSDTEQTIQKLLMERADELGLSASGIATTTVSNPAPQMQTISQETYFGAYRNTNPDGSSNASYLSGAWNILDQYAETSGQAKLVFPFTAKYVYIVASSTLPADVTVKVDGKAINTVEISNAQLYTLVSQSDVESHTLELDIPKSGLDVFTLTFGS